MKYILTYKFSQDHLELFFGAIRSAGGFNNNPTAQQFTAAYKRLLLRSSIEGRNRNCKKQDKTDILEIITDSDNRIDKMININDVALIRKYDLEKVFLSQQEENFSNVPNIPVVSEFKTAAISYIAGFVVKMITRKITCSICCGALGSSQLSAESDFLSLKDKGGLIKPTKSVIDICIETEKYFQRMLSSTDGHLPQSRGLPNAIAISVLSSTNMATSFEELNEHMFDTTVTDNHTHKLIKAISTCYSKIRFYHLGKCYTEKLYNNKVRKRLSKLVLFKHQ